MSLAVVIVVIMGGILAGVSGVVWFGAIAVFRPRVVDKRFLTRAALAIGTSIVSTILILLILIRLTPQRFEMLIDAVGRHFGI